MAVIHQTAGALARTTTDCSGTAHHASSTTADLRDRFRAVLSRSLGYRATTGYQLALSEIREMPDEVWVRYAIIRPGTNCAAAQVIGHPSLSILIPRTTKPVRFYETAAAKDRSSFKNESEMRQLLEKD